MADGAETLCYRSAAAREQCDSAISRARTSSYLRLDLFAFVGCRLWGRGRIPPHLQAHRPRHAGGLSPEVQPSQLHL